MGVDVAGDAGAGAGADVEAHVEAVGVHGDGEGLLAEGEEFHHLGAFVGGEFHRRGRVAVGGGHEMAIDVGIFVEHQQAQRAAGEHEVGLHHLFGGPAAVVQRKQSVGAVGDGFKM